MACGGACGQRERRPDRRAPAARERRASRGRDPARRHDQLHRLAEPVQLHRGAGDERHDHDLPAARAVHVRQGRDCKIEGDWATSWETSADGKDWTFHLHPDTKWSDGKPMTADDAAWTINTTVKYAERRRRRSRRAALAHVKSADAPDADDARDPLRRRRSATSSRSSSSSSSCRSTSGSRSRAPNGKGLKTYHPELHLPIVTRRRLHDQAVREEGHDGLHARTRTSTGPPSHARGGRAHVLHELRLDDRRPRSAGQLDWVDQVPFNAVNVGQEGPRTSSSTRSPGAETTNITWNSNPRKPKNRELLDPQVKKALSMCVDRAADHRRRLRSGYATTVESLVGHISAAREPEPGAAAVRLRGRRTQMLDKLGYKQGLGRHPRRPGDDRQVRPAGASDEVRDRHADLDRLQRRPRVRDRQGRASPSSGVKVTQKVGGDTTATYALETGDSCDAGDEQPATPASTSRCGTGSATSTRTSCSRSSPRPSGARGATPAGTTRPTTSSTTQQGDDGRPGEARKQIVYADAEDRSTTTSSTPSS